MVFKDYELFKKMKVRENVSLGIRRMRRREENERDGELIDIVGIGNMEDRYKNMM